MRLGPSLMLGSLAVLCLTAASHPPAVRTGTLEPTCAPWDGPALALDFPSAGHQAATLSVSIYSDFPRIPFHGPQTITLKPSLAGDA
jgi:hypothetical protein